MCGFEEGDSLGQFMQLPLLLWGALQPEEAGRLQGVQPSVKGLVIIQHLEIQTRR